MASRRPSLFDTLRDEQFKKLAPDQQRQLLLGAYPETAELADEGTLSGLARSIVGSRDLPDDNLQRLISLETGQAVAERPNRLQRAYDAALESPLGKSFDAAAAARAEQRRDYDYGAAERAGITRDETGHLPSRVGSGPEEGKILKRPQHETFGKTIAGEREAGFNFFRDRRTGDLYSFDRTPDPQRFEPLSYDQVDEEHRRARGEQAPVPAVPFTRSAAARGGPSLTEPRPEEPPSFVGLVERTREAEDPGPLGRMDVALRENTPRAAARLVAGMLRSAGELLEAGKMRPQGQTPEAEAGRGATRENLDRWASEVEAWGEKTAGEIRGPMRAPKDLQEHVQEALGIVPSELLKVGAAYAAGGVPGMVGLTGIETAGQPTPQRLKAMGVTGMVGLALPAAARMDIGPVGRAGLLGMLGYKAAEDEPDERRRLADAIVQGLLGAATPAQGRARTLMERRYAEGSGPFAEMLAEVEGIEPTLSRFEQAKAAAAFDPRRGVEAEPRHTTVDDVVARAQEPGAPMGFPQLEAETRFGGPPTGEPIPRPPPPVEPVVEPPVAAAPPSLPKKGERMVPSGPGPEVRLEGQAEAAIGAAFPYTPRTNQGFRLVPREKLGPAIQGDARMVTFPDGSTDIATGLEVEEAIPYKERKNYPDAYIQDGGTYDQQRFVIPFGNTGVVEWVALGPRQRGGRGTRKYDDTWVEQALAERMATEFYPHAGGMAHRSGLTMFPDGNVARFESAAEGFEAIDRWNAHQDQQLAAADSTAAERAAAVSYGPGPEPPEPAPVPVEEPDAVPEPAPPIEGPPGEGETVVEESTAAPPEPPIATAPADAGFARPGSPGQWPPILTTRQELTTAVPEYLGRELVPAEIEILKAHEGDYFGPHVLRGIEPDAEKPGADFWHAIVASPQQFRGPLLEEARRELWESTEKEDGAPLPIVLAAKPLKSKGQKDLLGTVGVARSRDETRYNLNLVVAEEGPRGGLVATDGHRLHFYRTGAGAGSEPGVYRLTETGTREWVKAGDPTGEERTYRTGPGETLEYPNWRQILDPDAEVPGDVRWAIPNPGQVAADLDASLKRYGTKSGKAVRRNPPVELPNGALVGATYLRDALRAAAGFGRPEDVVVFGQPPQKGGKKAESWETPTYWRMKSTLGAFGQQFDAVVMPMRGMRPAIALDWSRYGVEQIPGAPAEKPKASRTRQDLVDRLLAERDRLMDLEIAKNPKGPVWTVKSIPHADKLKGMKKGELEELARKVGIFTKDELDAQAAAEKKKKAPKQLSKSALKTKLLAERDRRVSALPSGYKKWPNAELDDVVGIPYPMALDKLGRDALEELARKLGLLEEIPEPSLLVEEPAAAEPAREGPTLPTPTESDGQARLPWAQEDPRYLGGGPPGARWHEIQQIVPGVTNVDSTAPQKIKATSLILSDLVRSLGLTLATDSQQMQRQWRLHNAIGVYWMNNPWVSRSAYVEAHVPRGALNILRWGDLQTAAHEIMHALVERHPSLRRLFMPDGSDANLTAEQLAAIREVRKQTVAVSYDMMNPEEGLTELFRAWMTQEDRAQDVAPDAVLALERELQAVLSPDQWKAVKKAQARMHEHLRASLREIVEADHSPLAKQGDPASSPFWGPVDTLIEQGFDREHVLLHLERVLFGAPEPGGVFEAFRRLAHIGEIVDGLTMKGAPTYRRPMGAGGANLAGTFGWAGEPLQEVLKEVAWSPHRQAQFETYARMKMAKELFPQRIVRSGKVVAPEDFDPVEGIPTQQLYAEFDQVRQEQRAAYVALDVKNVLKEIRKLEARQRRSDDPDVIQEKIDELRDSIQEWVDLRNTQDRAKALLDMGKLRDSYLEAKKYGREKKYAPDQFNAAIREYENLPQFKETFDKLVAWNNRVLDFAEQTGILARENRENFRRKEYAFGLYKQFPKRGADLAARYMGGTDNALRTLRGSTRPERGMVDALIYGASRIVQLGYQNVAMQQLEKALSAPGGGMFAQPINPSLEVTRAEVARFSAALRRELRKLGMEDRTIAQRFGALDDLEEIESLAWISGVKKPYGDDVFTVMRGGKPHYWQVTEPHLLARLQQLGTRESADMLIQFLNAMRKFYQGTVVLSPDFMAKNIVRDTALSSIVTQSGPGSTFALSAAKGVFSSIRNDADYWDFVVNGGGSATRYNDPIDHQKAIHRHAARHNLKNVITSPVELMHFLRNVLSPSELLHLGSSFGRHFEVASKLGEYKRLRAGGMAPAPAAFRGAEVNTDFATGGANRTLRQLVQSIPFLNAMLAGNYNFYRKFRVGRTPKGWQSDDGKRTAAARAARVSIYALSSAALALWHSDEDWYQQAPLWEKLSFDLFDTGAVDEAGEPVIARIPKPFEPGLLANLLTLGTQAATGSPMPEDKSTAAALTVALWTNFQFGAPPPIEMAIEQIANRSMFTWRPIEDQGMQQLQPWARYRANTPMVFKLYGEKLQQLGLGEWAIASPARAEQAWRSAFNTLGWYAVLAGESVTDQGVAQEWTDFPVVRGFVRKGGRYDADYGAFIEGLTEMNRTYNTARQMELEGRSELADQVLGELPLESHAEFKAADKMRKAILGEIRMIESGQVDDSLPGAGLGLSMRERRLLARKKLIRELHQVVKEPVANRRAAEAAE